MVREIVWQIIFVKTNFLHVDIISCFTFSISLEGGFGLLQASLLSTFKRSSISLNREPTSLNSKSQKLMTNKSFKKITFTNKCPFSKSDNWGQFSGYLNIGFMFSWCIMLTNTGFKILSEYLSSSNCLINIKSWEFTLCMPLGKYIS